MTVTLRFTSEESLRIAIATAALADAASKPARAWRDERAVMIQPRAALDKSAMSALRESGVESRDGVRAPKDALDARCWAEVVAMKRGAIETAERVVFVAPDAETMLETAGELLRLGCDRQEMMRADGAFLLRATAPPFYTVARAIDRVAGVRAFVAAGERVWLEVGWTHPLALHLRPADDEIVFLSPHEPWRTVADGAWTNVYEIVDVVVPKGVRTHEKQGREMPRLRVPLRLAHGADESPTLWVIRRDAIEKVERMIKNVPGEVIEGLLFAVTTSSPPTVVLRARPSKKPIAIEIDGEAFHPHMQIANLFLPRARSIEPPLRRDVVRELLAPDADAITWVTGDGDAIAVERIADAAFVPLASWVEYAIDRATELDAWVQSARFEFAEYVVEAEPSRPEDDHEDDEPKKKSKKREPPRAPEPPPPARVETSRAKTKIIREDAPTSNAAPDAVIEELVSIERDFIALQTPADDPARTDAWRTMGELNARAGRAKDATLCFTRVVWAAKRDARDVVELWASRERTRTADEILTMTAPEREDVSALAAILARASLAGETVDAARAALWLDRHDDVLDLRSLWLARAALSRLVGRDELGLARARDRILQKLHHGLSLDRDVPTFLRVVAGSRDPAQVERLAAGVQSLVKKFEKTKRRASTVEAPPSLTLAYVLLVSACGCARLGRVEQARAFAERAKKLLDLEEPVHGFLGRAYLARIDQAIEGLPAETPLPADVAARLNALDTFARYKVDRVRQFSNVLEPQERLDPVAAFHRGERDPRGPEFEPLRGQSDVVALEESVAQIVAKAKKSAPDERARLYDGVMDFFPLVPADAAIAHLETIEKSVGDVPTARRAQLLEEALMLGGHVGDQELARRLFTALRDTLASLDVEAAAPMTAVLGGTLRTLRRVGLRDEASELLATMQKIASGDGLAARIARVHAASALAYTGAFDKARPVFDATLTALSRDMPMPARLDLTRALTRALAHAPFDYALASLQTIADKLDVVTDSFNTNSHVCVSVVAFMESLVFGYASDELGVSDAGRKWLDDDEYLIRKRIQRETT